MEVKKLTEMIAKRVYPETEKEKMNEETKRDINKYLDSIAKRIFPITEKEKTCIDAFGKRVIKIGKFKKSILAEITKYQESDSTK
ncbi:MAG TPA: hypothetical protein VFV31_03715 [Chitinophagaceae bacterium]|nr:hypothetical protein [Chitinophagaceae bacterium]